MHSGQRRPAASFRAGNRGRTAGRIPTTAEEAEPEVVALLAIMSTNTRGLGTREAECSSFWQRARAIWPGSFSARLARWLVAGCRVARTKPAAGRSSRRRQPPSAQRFRPAFRRRQFGAGSVQRRNPAAAAQGLATQIAAPLSTSTVAGGCSEAGRTPDGRHTADTSGRRLWSQADSATVAATGSRRKQHLVAVAAWLRDASANSCSDA
jgi:hypothetical protein